MAAGLLLTACSGDEDAGDGPSGDGTTSDATDTAGATGGPDDAGATDGADDAGATDGADDAGATDGPDDAGATSGPDDTGATDRPEEDTPALPGGALGEQAAWVVEQLAPDATGPTEQEAQERFTDAFLQEVPADQLESHLETTRSAGELTLVAVTEEATGQVTLRLSGDEPLLILLAVDEEGLISGLRLSPDISATAPQLDSWEEVDAGLTDLGATTQVYAADVRDGVCHPVYESPDSEPAPSGSAFKLIVLSAVVDAVADGDLAWDDELTLTADLKSLPSGQLQDEEDGATVTVREAAELMIAISDNTGTDLLMDAVGDERVQAAVETVAEDPDRLTPLLTTREFFLLGWGAPEVQEQWAQADAQERVALVDDLPSDLSGLHPFSVTTPAWTEGVGWFLTGPELCAVHAILQEQAQTEAGEPVRDILSANPGLVPPSQVTYQGFKGGSAPGVLAMTFYQETGDGDGRVFTMQVRHDGNIYADGFTELTQSGLNLLATG